MRHHDGSKEFRTSFGRGGAGNLRRVSEAQHAHNLLLQMRRGSADVDAAAVARATPGHHFHLHHSNTSGSTSASSGGRRKSGSISSSLPSMTNLFESLRRRVSSASSLSSMGTSPTSGSMRPTGAPPRQHPQPHDSQAGGDDAKLDLGREASSLSTASGGGECLDDEDSPARRLSHGEDDDNGNDSDEVGGGPQMAAVRRKGRAPAVAAASSQAALGSE